MTAITEHPRAIPSLDPRRHRTAESPGHTRSILRAETVTKRYQLGHDNYVDALRGASVTIPRGEMTAIMGPSGSGKSTLLHVMGCLDTADSGRLWLNERRVDELSGREVTKLRRREVGFIFQSFNLVTTLTAQENVALAAEYAGRSRREAARVACEMLEQVGLEDRLRHLPSELSGGQQQRVAIARALVNRPALIMGDEPTGNLDTISSAEIMAMMREINLATGTTFVLVTHDPEVADACDHVVTMRDGLVVGQDGVSRGLAAAV